ncbi:MAG: GntR family transcriptional regulator [Smithellaceae bacterium]|nr:GntR family transcriptional regulator [Smithellaceae bacterium]
MANRQVHEKVVRVIMRDIFTNKLKPGTKMPAAKELSKLINIDLSSLRIALKQLEAMNVLAIKQGDGIYVKDYLQHAGIDFLRLLFDQEADDGKGVVLDECLIDEMFEYWITIFPEMMKLAATRFTLRDLKTLMNLVDEELESIPDRQKIVDIEDRQQHLVAEVCHNTIFLLLSNSSRPMRRKMIEMFISNISDDSLRRFIEAKKILIMDFANGSITDAREAAEQYREILTANRQLVRKIMFQNEVRLAKEDDREILAVGETLAGQG